MSTDPKSSPRGLQALVFYLGGAALLFAMAADAIAVLGRHIRIPLLGSIELVQAAMLAASSAAIVSATLAEKHAVVHLLIDRVPPRARSAMQRVHSALCAIFFLALTAGSIWIAFDLRGSYEQSEVLNLPVAPLRIVSIAAVFAVALIYLRRAIKGPVRP